MTNLSTIPQAKSVTQLLSKLLGSQELAKHKATLAMELEVLAKKFDRFGWDRDRGSYAQERLLTDWMEALQDYPLSEVQAACAASVLSNPNKMPNEGHVKAQIIAARQKAVSAQPKPFKVTPERGPVSADMKARADDIASHFLKGAKA